MLLEAETVVQTRQTEYWAVSEHPVCVTSGRLCMYVCTDLRHVMPPYASSLGVIS